MTSPLRPGSSRADILIYSESEGFSEGCAKLPLLRALRGAWPQGRITWLAGKGESAFAEELGPLADCFLDRVIEDANIGESAAQLLFRPMAEERFDLVIDTQLAWKTAAIVKRIRHDLFISGASDFGLSDIRPADPTHKPAAEIVRLLRLLELACGDAAPIDAPFELDPEIEALAAALLPDGYEYILFAPTATDLRLSYPLNDFALAARTVAHSQRTAVVLLDPTQDKWSAHVAGMADQALFPLQHRVAGDARDRADLVVALARRCAVGIADDGAYGHLLALGDLPLVSLFGPSDPDLVGPLALDGITLRAQDFGGPELWRIPPAAILSAMEELLRG